MTCRTAWLAVTSTVVAPARCAIARWADSGIIWSSVAIRYELGLLRQTGSVTGPSMASTANGTCASAMNAASAVGRSAPNELWNPTGSWNKNLPGADTSGDPGALGSRLNVLADSSLSGANAAM